MPLDSSGKPINVGDPIRFRGEEYKIEGFKPGEGRYGTSVIILDRESHTSEIPDEINVDLIF